MCPLICPGTKFSVINELKLSNNEYSWVTYFLLVKISFWLAILALHYIQSHCGTGHRKIHCFCWGSEWYQNYAGCLHLVKAQFQRFGRENITAGLVVHTAAILLSATNRQLRSLLSVKNMFLAQKLTKYQYCQEFSYNRTFNNLIENCLIYFNPSPISYTFGNKLFRTVINETRWSYNSLVYSSLLYCSELSWTLK